MFLLWRWCGYFQNGDSVLAQSEKLRLEELQRADNKLRGGHS